MLLLLLVACGGGDSSAGDTGGDTGGDTFASSLNVDTAALERSASGLRYRDLTQGSGEPASSGQTVSVRYTGWLPDGTEFDSNRNGPPFSFTIGAEEVIPGWDEGVAGMREGGRRQLVIPPDLAYGAAGAGGVIPPNATLVFEVELLGIQ